MECKNMQIMFLDEYYLLFVKYMQEKAPSDILELCWEKGQSFWKKFSNVEMFKMKNNTITVIWFLYDVQNYADLRWASFYSIWIIFHIVLYLIQ